MWILAAAALAVATPVAAQQDTTRLPPGVALETRYTKLGRPVVAVRPFTGPVPLAGVVEGAADIVRNDLGLSDRFEMFPVPQDLSAGPIAYDAWNSLNVVYLISGEITPTGTGYELRITAHDVVYGNEKQSGTFTLPATNSPDYRLAVHVASDAIVRWLTGQPGIAATRVAFVRRNGDSYDLLVVDSDGENLRRVAGSGSLLYSPAWSPDGGRLAYTLKDEGSWRLIERDMSNGRTRVLASDPLLLVSPTYSPDGNRIAFGQYLPGSRTQAGVEVHDYDVARGCCLRRLTDSGGDNMVPSYSADGRRIAFLSTRTGRQHIYVMDADGSNARVLTPFGERVEYNAPNWSPMGSRIAFHGQSRGTFQLMVADADRPGAQIVQLTSAGWNEDPSWAPDGRHIVYSTSGAGGQGLYVIDTVTGHLRPLMRGANLLMADWSPSLAGAFGAAN